MCCIPKRLAVAGLLAIVAVALTVAPAQAAGCLASYNVCEGCAKETLRQAMKDWDLVGIRRANIELWDCAIDLHHCVFYGQHHEYGCAV